MIGIITMRSCYTEAKLERYTYFRELMKEQSVSSFLDSLTGLISRQYIFNFIHSLIDNRVPFTMALLDLDNFKFINDTYGHKVGDGVLEGVAADMMRYCDDIGIVGRIGGDEFLLVNLRDLQYDQIKSFYLQMYANFNVMRKNIDVGTCSPFITGTLGSATFPYNADNFDDLFALVDKTLYRGKIKGRNCYIIYVKEKHQNIEIQELKGHGLYVTFHDLAKKFDSSGDIHDKLLAMFEIMKEDLRISEFYYIDANYNLKSIHSDEIIACVPDIENIMTHDLYNSNSLAEFKQLSPLLYKALVEREIETIMVTRVEISHRFFGYLMCAEPRTLRIWQEDEFAVLFFISRLVAGYLYGEGQTL